MFGVFISWRSNNLNVGIWRSTHPRASYLSPDHRRIKYAINDCKIHLYVCDRSKWNCIWHTMFFFCCALSIANPTFHFHLPIAWVHNFGDFCFWQYHAMLYQIHIQCLSREYLWWDFKQMIELFFTVNFSHFLIETELMTSFTHTHITFCINFHLFGVFLFHIMDSCSASLSHSLLSSAHAFQFHFHFHFVRQNPLNRTHTHTHKLHVLRMNAFFHYHFKYKWFKRTNTLIPSLPRTV